MIEKAIGVKVIVTADDFGISSKVNEGIVVGFREGVVRNTSLLVNFRNVEESVACLRDTDGIDVGIHLNLTCGSPVSNREQVGSLVGDKGKFVGLRKFLTRVSLGRVDLGEVRREWETQIEVGLGLGCKFTSISSHQHVHMLPQMIRIAAMLAREYGIPAVRLSQYHPARMSWPKRVKALALCSTTPAARRVLQQQKVFYNDYALEIPALSVEKGLARLCDVLQQIPRGVYEMVCHPGYVDDTLQCRDRYTVERLLELEVLTSPRIQEVFEKDGIELTTYRALTAAD